MTEIRFPEIKEFQNNINPECYICENNGIPQILGFSNSCNNSVFPEICILEMQNSRIPKIWNGVPLSNGFPLWYIHIYSCMSAYMH